MLTLIIKGNSEQAVVAAAERGVVIEVKDDTLRGEVRADADEHYTTQVSQWFSEEPAWEQGKGFPPGTLLFYR